MRHVSILLYPYALSSSIGLPVEMLQAANEISRVKYRHRATLAIEVVGLNDAPIECAGGTRLLPDRCWESLQKTDMIILPALWRKPLKLAHRETRLLRWLCDQWSNGSYLCAVGNASFLLAQAGLLDNLPATTHWHFFPQFAENYPKVLLKRQHLITKAGRLFCAGSVNSLADLIIEFIGRAFGREIAECVEQHFSPEIRQSCDTRMFDFDAMSPHADEHILYAQHWLRTHYDQAISMPALAARAGMTVRSFNRRFKNACGDTPTSYLMYIRMENAKQMLKHSNLSIAEIALCVGYGDASHFATVFKKHIGTTPRLYRVTVRAKLFSDT
jgi:transcriptional regulator GlxA family with amidase domain